MTRSTLLASATACVLGCLLSSAPAQGAPKSTALPKTAPRAPATPRLSPRAAAAAAAVQAKARRNASALYEEGRAAMEAGDGETCERKFDEAYRTLPNAMVLLKVAACRRLRSDNVGAVATLEQYLTERPDAPDRAVVESQIADLRKTKGAVSITSTPSSAAIWVDGEDTRQITPGLIEMSPGEHTVTLKLHSYEAAEQNIVVPFGAKRDLDLQLDVARKASAPPLDPTPSDHGPGYHPTPLFWVAAGGAVAAVGVATVFGVMALDKHSRFEDTPTRELYDDGRRDALIADVALGVGLASGVTAAVLFFNSKGADRPPDETAFSVVPSFSRSGGGVVGNVRF